MNKILWPLLFLCVGAASLTAQVTAVATLDKTEILIGDQVAFNLSVSAAEGYQVRDIDLRGLQDMEKIELVQPNLNRFDTLKTETGYVIEKNLILTSFDSGYHYVPPVTVKYVYQGRSLTTKTNEIPLMVKPFPMVADTAQLAPIKNIIEEPIKIEDVWPYLLAIAGLGLLIGLGVYLYNKRKNTQAEVEEVIEKRPAHEIALDKLQRLKAAELWQKGQIKEYHSELTYIFREYLENRFEVRALESTTYEIMNDIRTLKIESKWEDRIRELLQTADMIKFAKATPPTETHNQAFELTEEFVQETMKEEEEMGEEQEEDSNSNEKQA